MYPPVKIPAKIKPFYLSRIEELEAHNTWVWKLWKFSAIQCKKYVIGIDLRFKLQRWSRRADDYFEISVFEDHRRFFWNRHPKPLELVISRFIQPINRAFNKTTLKTRQGQEKQKSVWQMKWAQWPFNTSWVYIFTLAHFTCYLLVLSFFFISC